MNSEGHYLVVISVAECSDRHYKISLPGSDLHYSFFTVCSLCEIINNLLLGLQWLVAMLLCP